MVSQLTAFVRLLSAFIIVQCCASHAAFLPQQQRLPQTPFVSNMKSASASLSEHLGSSMAAAAHHGPGGHLYERWDGLLPIVPQEDADVYAYVYVLHKSRWISFCVAVGLLVLPAAVGTLEQLLNSFGHTFVIYVEHIAETTNKKLDYSLWQELQMLFDVLCHKLHPVWSAWQHGINADCKILSSAAAAYMLAFTSLAADSSYFGAYWSFALDLIVLTTLFVAGCCANQRANARSAVFCTLLAAFVMPLKAKLVLQAGLMVIMVMPSVTKLSVLEYSVMLLTLVVFVVFVAAVYLVLGLYLMLKGICKSVTNFSSMWWLCKTSVRYTWLAVWYSVVALIGMAYMLVTGTYWLLKQACLYTLSGLNRVFVFLGASELAAAAVIGRHWQQLKARMYMQYKHVRRIHRRTAGNPAAFLSQTVHWLVTGDLEAARCGSNASGASKQQHHKHQQQGAAELPFRHSSNGSDTANLDCQARLSSHGSMDAPILDCGTHCVNTNNGSSTNGVPTITAEEADLSDVLLLAHTSSKQPKANPKAARQQTNHGHQHMQGKCRSKGPANNVSPQTADTAGSWGPASGVPAASTKASTATKMTTQKAEVAPADGQSWVTVTKQSVKGSMQAPVAPQVAKASTSKKHKYSNTKTAAAQPPASCSNQTPSTAAPQQQVQRAVANKAPATAAKSQRKAANTKATLAPAIHASTATIAAPAAPQELAAACNTSSSAAAIKVLNSAAKLGPLDKAEAPAAASNYPAALNHALRQAHDVGCSGTQGGAAATSTAALMSEPTAGLSDAASDCSLPPAAAPALLEVILRPVLSDACNTAAAVGASRSAVEPALAPVAPAAAAEDPVMSPSAFIAAAAAATASDPTLVPAAPAIAATEPPMWEAVKAPAAPAGAAADTAAEDAVKAPAAPTVAAVDSAAWDVMKAPAASAAAYSHPAALDAGKATQAPAALVAAAVDPAAWDAVKAPAAAKSSKLKSKQLKRRGSTFADVVAGGSSMLDTSAGAAATEPEFTLDSDINSLKVLELPSWLQRAPSVGPPGGAELIQQQQQPAVLLGSSSSRSETVTVSPQVSGPYRPLQFSNSTIRIVSPGVSPTATLATAAAAEEAFAADHTDGPLQLLKQGWQWPISCSAPAACTAVSEVEVQPEVFNGSVASAAQDPDWADNTGAAGASHWDAAWSALAAAAAAAQLQQEGL